MDAALWWDGDGAILRHGLISHWIAAIGLEQRARKGQPEGRCYPRNDKWRRRPSAGGRKALPKCLPLSRLLPRRLPVQRRAARTNIHCPFLRSSAGSRRSTRTASTTLCVWMVGALLVADSLRQKQILVVIGFGGNQFGTGPQDIRLPAPACSSLHRICADKLALVQDAEPAIYLTVHLWTTLGHFVIHSLTGNVFGVSGHGQEGRGDKQNAYQNALHRTASRSRFINMTARHIMIVGDRRAKVRALHGATLGRSDLQRVNSLRASAYRPIRAPEGQKLQKIGMSPTSACPDRLR
jgi:hypothetical protein